MYRILIATSLFVCLIVTIPLSTTSANNAQINANNLNVRNEPNAQGEVIDQVHFGDVYNVLHIQDDWAQIEVLDKVGWISMEYITLMQSDEGKKIQSSPKDKSTALLHNTTHMRSGPSSTYEITSYIEKGTEITVVPENEDWYLVTYNGKTGYILKEIVHYKQMTRALHNKTITIDAGHGGQDVGSISSSGIYEKDLSIYTAIKLKHKLTSLGAKVVLTRRNDEYIRLASRSSLANITDTDAFVSIHYNSFPKLPSISGIGTYYYQETHKSLADAVQTNLIQVTNATDRGIAFENYQVLRQNYKPAILVELGFISNNENEQLLLTDPYQEKLVKGIINGLTSYFES